MKNNEPLVLILCGGRSLRLWPLSEYKSKNFLDIFGFSPLELTIRRFSKITSSNNIFLITNCKEKNALIKLKLIKKENIFCEPESKNTAAAILLALFYLRKKFSQDKPLIISPVDHLIKNEEYFYSAVKKSLAVSKNGWICTLGIKPTQATPNFGYIQVDKEVEKDVFSIKRFVEKPTRPQAQELIRKGDSFYNSGMFISSIHILDKEYKKHYSYYNIFFDAFRRIKHPCDKNVSYIYKKLEDIPFDKAIMEKTAKIRLIRANFFWRDFGSWHSIYEVLPKDASGNVKRGKAFIYNGENNFIYLDDLKKKVLLLGLKDIFFIDTDDYTLLAHRHYLDNLKLALKEFKKKVK
ncbi:MAG: sugar phosphate nucleotidyltransferase [Candidatus Omnitrophota bacterium]|nr:sugar phosphate nucleotidyltransferase [Candidatus Omnitrophota bacterium]